MKCGHCVDICPLDAIKMLDYPTIDFDKCLECYHCYYACPNKAIYLKKTFTQRLMQIARRLLRL